MNKLVEVKRDTQLHHGQEAQTVFKDTGEVSGVLGGWGVASTVKKLTEVLSSLPLMEYLQGTAFLFCPYTLAEVNSSI